MTAVAGKSVPRTAADAAIEIDNSDWLGDLYQHDCENARKERALVQTPGFIANFLLDRTVMQALSDDNLEAFRMIDPACGTGHILVRAFCQVFSAWRWARPKAPLKEAVQKSLLSICGIDLDPVCVALARIRLLIAAGEILREEDMARLARLRLNVVQGDALLDGRRPREPAVAHPQNPEAYALLQPGRYHAVVANPPYIRPPTKELRDAYRARYPEVCCGRYSLSVPFTVLLFELAIPGTSPDGTSWLPWRGRPADGKACPTAEERRQLDLLDTLGQGQ